MKPRTRVWALGILAALSFLTYWVLVALSLNPKLSIVHNVGGATYGGPLTWPSRWLHLAGISPQAREWLFIFLVAVLTVMWLAAIYVVRRDNRRSLTIIIAGAFGAFALLFVFGPAFQSTDVFSYAWMGRVMSVYHRNPYVLLPVQRPHDIFYPMIGWKYNTSVYGPVFHYVSYFLARIGGNSIARSVLLYKLLACASYAACLALVYNLTRRIAPGRENMALAVSAWCPILVMHILGGAHNDLLMVAFVLGGYLLYRKGYLLAGIAVAAVAVAVKLTAALALAPLIVLYVRDRQGAQLKRLVAGGATSIAVIGLLYLPFWDGMKIFSSTSHMSKLYSGASVPRLVSFEYQKILTRGGMSASRAAAVANSRVQLLFLAIMAAGAVILLLGVKDFRSMAACAGGLVLLWFLTTTYILPWYLALGLLVVAISGWNLTTGLLVAASAILGLYRIPLAKSISGPTTYIALPLATLLAAWLVTGGYSRWKARRATSEATATEGALGLEPVLPEN